MLLATALVTAPTVVGIPVAAEETSPPQTSSVMWARSTAHHVVVQQGYPDARNYDKETDGFGVLQAGRATGQAGIARSYVELDIADLSGKYIVDAKLSTRVASSRACEGGAAELWSTGPISPDTTWANQPQWFEKVASRSVFNNAEMCPGFGGADFSITETVRDAVEDGRSTLTLMLKAEDGRPQSWREFDLKPVLRVTYNSYPDEPSELSMQNGLVDCATGDDRPAITTTTPQLQARVSDPDRGTLDTGFRILRGVGPEAEWDGHELLTGNIPSGSIARVTVAEGTLDEGLYTWRLWASDGQAVAWSRDCEFTVDTTAPAPPTVTSDDYPEDTQAGGVERPGDFVISAGGDTDVDHFLYSFTGGSQQKATPGTPGGDVTIRWTPTMDGPHTLSVRSVDRAGNRSEIHRYGFWVKYQEPLGSPAGHWTLNGDLADGSSHQRTLVATGDPSLDAVGYEGSAVEFDGSDDWLSHPETLVDTSDSFSVAAWVNPATADAAATVLSQQGEQADGFRLGVTAEGTWSFSASGVGGPGSVGSAEQVEPGVWTHVAGVYDAMRGQLRIYVDGVLSGAADHADATRVQGPFVVGRALENGVHTEFFAGAIDEVRVYERDLLGSEVALAASQAVQRAHYAMEEADGTTTRDEVSGRDAVLHGGASWEVQEFTSIVLDAESEQYVSASLPELRTDRSYTVAAWVRMNDRDTQKVALSIGDAEAAPFVLGYRPDDRRWAMSVACSSGEDCEWAEAPSYWDQVGEWVHLTAVYDAVAQEARLYVDGRKGGVATGVIGGTSAGELNVGRAVRAGVGADYWSGAVDDVKVYSGVLDDRAIFQLAFR